MRIVADTNVIVSMLVWKKSLVYLSDLLNSNKIILCFSPETIDELFRVIDYPKIKKVTEKLHIDLNRSADKLVAASLICYPDKTLNIIKEDPSDNRFLEVALEIKAEAIISGDKHLLNIRKFRNIPIYSPKGFLNTYHFK